MEKAIEEYDSNLLFLKHLRKNNNPTLIEKVRDIHDDVFNSTDCLSCANCCKSSPPIVSKKDAKRMSKVLGIPPKTVIKKYLIADVDGSMMMNGVPCTFLQEDNTCSIYEHRPTACRSYPHTDDSNYLNKPKFNIENTVVCPAAYTILKRLDSTIKTIGQ